MSLAIRSHRVGHERARHTGLHQQMNGQPSPKQRHMAFASPRAPHSVTLPKVIDCGLRLLAIVAVHRVPAKELPAFIQEKPKAGLPGCKKLGQPFERRFGHAAVNRRGCGPKCFDDMTVSISNDPAVA